jgi:hypothetical protein
VLLLCKEGIHEKKARMAIKGLCDIEKNLTESILSHNKIHDGIKYNRNIDKKVSAMKDLISLLENMKKSIAQWTIF